MRLAGQNLSALDEDGRAALRGRELGFVFQSFHLLPALTALENAMLPLELLGQPHRVHLLVAVQRDLVQALEVGDIAQDHDPPAALLGFSARDRRQADHLHGVARIGDLGHRRPEADVVEQIFRLHGAGKDDLEPRARAHLLGPVGGLGAGDARIRGCGKLPGGRSLQPPAPCPGPGTRGQGGGKGRAAGQGLAGDKDHRLRGRRRPATAPAKGAGHIGTVAFKGKESFHGRVIHGLVEGNADNIAGPHVGKAVVGPESDNGRLHRRELPGIVLAQHAD